MSEEIFPIASHRSLIDNIDHAGVPAIRMGPDIEMNNRDRNRQWIYREAHIMQLIHFTPRRMELFLGMILYR
jgi:hypothetical protein